MKQSPIGHVFRATISLVAMAAWFHASNHCAIGEMLAKPSPASEHASCHTQETPLESEESGDCVDLSCCKALAAPAPSFAKSTPGDALALYAANDSGHGNFSFRLEHDEPIAELDTGPPEGDSFAEAVLQRSLLAHAPPLA